MALFWCKEVKMNIPKHMFVIHWDGIQERFRTKEAAVRRYLQVSLLDKKATITQIW